MSLTERHAYNATRAICVDACHILSYICHITLASASTNWSEKCAFPGPVRGRCGHRVVFRFVMWQELGPSLLAAPILMPLKGPVNSFISRPAPRAGRFSPGAMNRNLRSLRDASQRAHPPNPLARWGLAATGQAQQHAGEHQALVHNSAVSRGRAGRPKPRCQLDIQLPAAHEPASAAASPERRTSGQLRRAEIHAILLNQCLVWLRDLQMVDPQLGVVLA